MGEQAGLREVFLGALDTSARPTFEKEDHLDAALSALLENGRAGGRGLRVSDEAFIAHVAHALPADAQIDALEKLRGGDLFLACACAAGDDRALAIFDAEYGRDIDLAISRSGNVDLGKDEFRQLLRNKLFVAPEGRAPKIADYAGRGDLRSWVRVTALRMIVDIVRQRAGGKEVPMEADMLGAVPAPQDDPELEYIQRVYKNEFKDALQDAFANLSARERNLLRHQVIHGLNIDQVGALYRVHRTTAFRWIEKARKALLRETRAALMKRLQVGSSEFLSIMRVVQGDLDVSVRRLLVSDIEQEPKR
jgi:RNA polymerase sigma-70 factor, ECF subfamily